MFLVPKPEPYEVCSQNNHLIKMDLLSTQNTCCGYSKKPSEIAAMCTQNSTHFERQFLYTLNDDDDDELEFNDASTLLGH